MSETLTMANPIETEKIRTHHAKIVVEYTTGEPYYSIEWFDPAKNEYRLGYSSYCIDNVAAWLAEYFEIVEKPKTNADRTRAMSDDELATFVAEKIVNIENQKMIEQGHTPTATQLSALGHTMYCTLMRWLQQPAEGE